MGLVPSRQSHPISYRASPEGAFTTLAVHEVGAVGAPKPRLLDRVRAALRTRHYSRRTVTTSAPPSVSSAAFTG
jgi:hypothetical protein